MSMLGTAEEKRKSFVSRRCLLSLKFSNIMRTKRSYSSLVYFRFFNFKIQPTNLSMGPLEASYGRNQQDIPNAVSVCLKSCPCQLLKKNKSKCFFVAFIMTGKGHQLTPHRIARIVAQFLVSALHSFSCVSERLN